uniref:Uncharacterized protein n=1 Tax=Ceratitis capitata TaxID=7213 RepID=W8BZL8_CERCA
MEEVLTLQYFKNLNIASIKKGETINNKYKIGIVTESTRSFIYIFLGNERLSSAIADNSKASIEDAAWQAYRVRSGHYPTDKRHHTRNRQNGDSASLLHGNVHQIAHSNNNMKAHLHNIGTQKLNV